jgi:Eco57I restriction-modification methylase
MSASQQSSKSAPPIQWLDRCQVFTRPLVAEAMLDMVGWTEEGDLEGASIFEPGAGTGAFVVPAARRLLRFWKARGGVNFSLLRHSITAVEIDPVLCRLLRQRLFEVMIDEGFKTSEAKEMAGRWVRCEDFLALRLPVGITHIVGNPPFARNIDARADLFVAFAERCLDLMPGRLALISPFGWWTTRIARHLRKRVVQSGAIRAVVDLSEVAAFERDVSVHAVITVMELNGVAGTIVRARPRRLTDLGRIAQSVRAPGVGRGLRIFNVGDHSGPLLVIGNSLDSAVRAAKCLPMIESVGCSIRVGLATGANDVFIGLRDDLNVEPDVMKPVVEISDFVGNEISWRGRFAIDPFTQDGKLRTRVTHPRLCAHLAHHRARLEARSSVRGGMEWWRPLDRPNSTLVKTPKLLVPEVGSRIRVGLDLEGRWLPLHSLHSITSTEWPLRALRSALAFGILPFWALLLDVRRGRSNHRRLNASALRLVRLPRWRSVTDREKETLQTGDDPEKIGLIVAKWYKLRDSVVRQTMELTWRDERQFEWGDRAG